jgi:hypothetical protein
MADFKVSAEKMEAMSKKLLCQKVKKYSNNKKSKMDISKRYRRQTTASSNSKSWSNIRNMNNAGV